MRLFWISRHRFANAAATAEPSTSLKTTLMLALLAFALGAVSCRTTAPLDPMTMQPSARCTPGVSQSYK